MELNIYCIAKIKKITQTLIKVSALFNRLYTVRLYQAL